MVGPHIAIIRDWHPMLMEPAPKPAEDTRDDYLADPRSIANEWGPADVNGEHFT